MSRATFGPSAATSAFGDAVRDRRDRRGITQAELAARTDMTRSVITKIERGVCNVNIEQVVALARALGVTPGTLLRDASSA